MDEAKESFQTLSSEDFDKELNHNAFSKKKKNTITNQIIKLSSKQSVMCHMISFLLLLIALIIMIVVNVVKYVKIAELEEMNELLEVKIESTKKMIKDTDQSIKSENHQFDELSSHLSSYDTQLRDIKKKNKQYKEEEKTLKNDINLYAKASYNIASYTFMINDKERQIKSLNSMITPRFKAKTYNHAQNVLKQSNILLTEEDLARLEAISQMKAKFVCYNSNRMSYSGKVFTMNCQYFPNLMILIRIYPNIIIGGFIPFKLINKVEESIISKKVYLFNLTGGKKYYTIDNAIAVTVYKDSFPYFGSSDLFINKEEKIGNSEFPKGFVCDDCSRNVNMLTGGFNMFQYYEVEAIVME